MKLFEKSNRYGKHISISRFSYNRIAVLQHYRNGGRSDVLWQTAGKYYVALVLTAVDVDFKKCIQCCIIEYSNCISRHP